MIRVILELKYLKRMNNNVIYCKVIDVSNRETIISASYAYCVNACLDRNYQIMNAPEVLKWLADNAIRD